jgi:hypothetical protein
MCSPGHGWRRERPAFVNAQIIEDAHLALGQGRGKFLLDIQGEELAIDDPGCAYPVAVSERAR